MTNEAQQDLPPSPLILRAIAKAHDMRLDGLATVVSPGQVRTGDPLVLLQGPPTVDLAREVILVCGGGDLTDRPVAGADQTP